MGAFDDFKPPKPIQDASPAPALVPAPSGPFGNFKPSASPAPTPPAPAPTIPPGGTSFDPNWRPSGNAVWDFLTRPIAKTENPAAALKDYGLSAYDAATFGYGVPAAMKSAVAQAHENLGLMDYAAQGIGYGLGPGKVLGPVARGITRLAAPAVVAPTAGVVARTLGGVGAGALEGGAAGGLGSAGHGGDPTTGALLGAVTGGVTGAAGGGPAMRGPTEAEVGASTRTLPGGVKAPATGMVADKEAAYAPLANNFFSRTTTIDPAVQQFQRDLNAARRQAGAPGMTPIPDNIQPIVDRFNTQPFPSGEDIQSAIRDLKANGDQPSYQLAGAFKNILDKNPPLRGTTGEAGKALDQGDILHKKIEDLNRLGADPSQIPTGAVKRTMDFNPEGTPAGDALARLYEAQQPRFNFWSARHMAQPLVGAALGGAEGYFNPGAERNPYIAATKEAIEGAAVFGLGKRLAAARPASALNDARYAIASGRSPSTAFGRVGDYLANAWYGRLASGQAPGQ